MTYLPLHHPDQAVLVDYATGALSTPFAVAIAVHLTFCPECRRLVDGYEDLGGELLAELAPVACAPGALAAVLDRLDEEPRSAGRLAARPPASLAAEWALLPAPLQRHIATERHPPRWERITRGFERLRLSSNWEGVELRLLRFGPNWRSLPHAQKGTEMVVVLEGGFTDQFGSFARGDVGIVQPDVEHRPVADSEGCLCLAVWEGALKVSGPWGWLVNRLVRV